jgi:uncharacterized membrane protein/thiol-disulfide isomerase/thioredoxin
MTRSRRSKPRADAARNPAARPPRPTTPPDLPVAALAAAGLLVTGYLSYAALTSATPAFCTEGSGCDLIQQSQWSTLLGLPIALWGFATYALLLLLALLPQSRLRRWQRSWSVAFVGVAISSYLTIAGVWSLQAVCAWCLLSLLMIGAILLLVSWRRPPSAPGGGWRNWTVGHGLFALVLLLALHVYWSGLLAPRPDPRLEALAQHLTDSGAKFYGAFWCPTCREQKQLFGSAAERLPYVECYPSGRQGAVAFECVNADVRAFPTWVIRGRAYDNVMQPDELAQRSGFRWQPPAPATE